jgi:hypothetical protein
VRAELIRALALAVAELFERRLHRCDFGNRAHASVRSSASDGSGHSTVTLSSTLKSLNQRIYRSQLLRHSRASGSGERRGGGGEKEEREGSDAHDSDGVVKRARAKEGGIEDEERESEPVLVGEKVNERLDEYQRVCLWL